MYIQDNEPVVAFLLARYPQSYSLIGMAHLGLDRWPLARTAGLRFSRLLGVGKGRAFDPHADLQRYAMFTVWNSYADLKHFEATSSVIKRIKKHAEEVWITHMLPVRWHGKWGGSDPLAEIKPCEPPQPGPWIILTRATIRPTKLTAFLRAVPAVSTQLLKQEAFIDSVGVGEMPLLTQATVSIWQTLPAITQFAYKQNEHAQVIRQTRQERWYSEELFARFRPVASFGTWGGRDPLEVARNIEE